MAEGEGRSTGQEAGGAIRILSAGAPKTGVRLCAEAFEEKTATGFEVEFATAPKIRERMASGTADADVVVAPVAAMKEFAAAGRVAADSVAELGSVTIGVVVRNDLPDPDISSVDALVAAIRQADAIVFNEASSGRYIVELLERLGIAGEMSSRIVSVPNGAAVMQHLADHPGEKAIGFGQVTEIRLHDDLGTHLVGPLPDEVAKRTTYAAAVNAGASRPDEGRGLVAFMASPDGQAIFRKTGVA